MILTPSSSKRALISTIEPIDGGVPTMTRWLLDILEEHSIEPVIAWYQPWSSSPWLSVPFHKLWKIRRPGVIRRKVYDNYQGFGIGAWLPELEFTHYLPRKSWRELVENCNIFISVTGNVLSAAPYARLGLPFLAWVASPWEADRIDRVKSFSFPRRVLDTTINQPVIRALERKILRSPNSRILALSSYTASSLKTISGDNIAGILRMPVNTDCFRPSLDDVVPWRIGFSGRYLDPRKNIQLLLNAVTLLLQKNIPIELLLIGEHDHIPIMSRINDLGISDKVTFIPRIERSRLPSYLQTLDLFVIPSHQEGLCIAALEAMSCGIPVVSTYCGGPEDFVIPLSTGELVGPDPHEMSRSIEMICKNRNLRNKLSEGARAWVTNNAAHETAKATVLAHLTTLFPSITI